MLSRVTLMRKNSTALLEEDHQFPEAFLGQCDVQLSVETLRLDQVVDVVRFNLLEGESLEYFVGFHGCLPVAAN